MKITERLIAENYWYYDVQLEEFIDDGWEFKSFGCVYLDTENWKLKEVLDTDKFDNPILAIFEREIEI